MSSDGDHVAVQTSMNDNLADASTVHFSDKNFTFITDSTSNSGSFSSGQIQFDLSTLNSQSQWINLSEAVIEFPVKVTASVSTAGTTTTAGINTCIIKNGWHQWIDSAQLIINGQTIQSAQPYENVAGTFRILSSWSQDTLKKWGPTCGVALDDCTGDLTISTTSGFNAPAQTSTKGFDVINTTNLPNKGVAARATYTNSDIGTATLQREILGAAQMRQAGRSNVASLSGGSNTPGAVLMSAFYMATCRLKDLCDIGDFPMVKNLKGFLYLSFNSSQVAMTGASATPAAVSYQVLTGRSTPFMINTAASGGLGGASGTSVITITGSVDATTSGAISPSGPLITNARLLVPYYIANPKTDMALSNDSKFFTSLEKITNPVTVSAGSSVNYTITTGVPNPRRLVMLPMWQNTAGASNLVNPEISAFDSVPGTSGLFAGLQSLQVYLANKPVYQYPIQFDFEQWVSENSQLGLNSNLISEDTSGLLTEQLFEMNHRFYSVDLSRRTVSEDGASRSVQVSFTNPSPTLGMKVICIVFYEKQWVINTSTCMLQNV